MPTENDWRAFESIKQRDKTAVLYVYLGLKGYNMQEVAHHALGNDDDQASQIVSVITRCYGFSGRNAGKFVSLYDNSFRGFSQSDIDNFKLNDIKAFVDTHPYGNTTPEQMESFLRDRISERLSSYSDDDDDDEYYVENIPPQQTYRQPTAQPRQTYRQPAVQPQQTYRQPTAQPQQTAYIPPAASGAQYTGGSSGGYSRGFSTPRLPYFDWGTVGKVAAGIIGAALAIFLLSQIFGGSCVSGSSCVSDGSGILGIFGGSSSVNVNIDVAFFTDGTFDDVMIVVDNKYYNYLSENLSNKFAAELEKGDHTFRVEYSRNGVSYITDSLSFKVKEKDELVDLLVYPNGEELIIAFAGS